MYHPVSYRDHHLSIIPCEGMILKKRQAASLSGAKNGTRTRDPDLGKVVLYQLSYFRILYQRSFPLTRLQIYYFFIIAIELNKNNFLGKSSLKMSYFFNKPLISFNFINASTGVKVSISMFKISSFICSKRGSSNWIKLS